jgi:Ni/Co efflux regulator RcnB
MKKKIVVAFFAFAGVIALSQTDAQARPHKQHHHSVHRAVHKHRAAHHVPRGLRRHARRGSQHAGRGAGGRPGAWCGWWLGHQLGIPRRDLWVARNWASVGHNAGQPGIGVVVVWRHHVGIITGRVGSQWIVKSGNDRNAVRERPRSISGAIAFRHVGSGATGS